MVQNELQYMSHNINFNFNQLFLYYTCECPVHNSRIILIKIATYYSQSYASILGSGIHYNIQLPNKEIILDASIFPLGYCHAKINSTKFFLFNFAMYDFVTKTLYKASINVASLKLHQYKVHREQPQNEQMRVKIS